MPGAMPQLPIRSLETSLTSCMWGRQARRAPVEVTHLTEVHVSSRSYAWWHHANILLKIIRLRAAFFFRIAKFLHGASRTIPHVVTVGLSEVVVNIHTSLYGVIFQKMSNFISTNVIKLAFSLYGIIWQESATDKVSTINISRGVHYTVLRAVRCTLNYSFTEYV
jgi:hypothetical protein